MICKVLVPVVHSFELATVNGNFIPAEHIQPLGNQNELPAYAANGCSVVFAEIGNCFKVRSQAASQAHQLNIALRFALQALAGLNAVQVTTM
jgi:hypothetical protein